MISTAGSCDPARVRASICVWIARGVSGVSEGILLATNGFSTTSGGAMMKRIRYGTNATHDPEAKCAISPIVVFALAVCRGVKPAASHMDTSSLTRDVCGSAKPSPARSPMATYSSCASRWSADSATTIGSVVTIDAVNPVKSPRGPYIIATSTCPDFVRSISSSYRWSCSRRELDSARGSDQQRQP